MFGKLKLVDVPKRPTKRKASADCAPASGSAFGEMTTDALLDLIPNHLHLARNSNAPDHDRFRFYSTATKQYLEPGKPTAREATIALLELIEKQRREWTQNSDYPPPRSHNSQ